MSAKSEPDRAPSRSESEYTISDASGSLEVVEDSDTPELVAEYYLSDEEGVIRSETEDNTQMLFPVSSVIHSPEQVPPNPASLPQPYLCIDKGFISVSGEGAPASSSQSEAENSSSSSSSVACVSVVRTWQVAEKLTVLPIRCKNTSAELHKKRFGSGSRGKCIRYRGKWYTPNEFETLSGRGSCRDYRRTISFGGEPIQSLIDRGILAPHSLSCNCPACTDDEAAGPVKLFKPFNSRRSMHLSVERRRAMRYRAAQAAAAAAAAATSASATSTNIAGISKVTATVTSTTTSTSSATARSGAFTTMSGTNARNDHSYAKGYYSRPSSSGGAQNQVTRNADTPPEPPPQPPPRPAQRRTYGGATNGRNRALNGRNAAILGRNFANPGRVIEVINIYEENQHIGNAIEIRQAGEIIAQIAGNANNASKIILLEYEPERRPEPAVISLYVVNSSTNVVKKCTCCNTQTPNVCGMCRRKSYCSDYCQLKDWTNHEPNCTLSTNPSPPRYSMMIVPQE